MTYTTLSFDDDALKANFPAAYRFLTAAKLRSELYNLYIDDHPNDWTKKRIAELEQSPASETWHFRRLKEKYHNKIKRIN